MISSRAIRGYSSLRVNTYRTLIFAMIYIAAQVPLLSQRLSEKEVPQSDSALTDQSAPPEFLPFSIEQVLSYFKDAFGKQPEKINDKYFVFVDRGNPDESAIITIAELDKNMGIVLMATGDYGVNYIRDFFEAPIFLPSESKQFYIMLSKGEGFQLAELGRFNVQMGISAANDWIILALKFQPPHRYKPETTNLDKKSS
jgi:hypothetical protein